MRLPFVLAILLVAASAGCTALQGDDDEPLTPASTTTTIPTRATTTPPTPPSATTPPTPSSPPPTTTTSPTPPPPPPKPADHHANKSGFVAFEPGETFVTKLGFPVQAGAANVTASLNLTMETPAGPSLVQTSSATIRLVDPEGKTLKNASSELPAARESAVVLTLSLPAANLTKTGEYTLVVEITGLSDGESLGQRFLATVDVKY